MREQVNVFEAGDERLNGSGAHVRFLPVPRAQAQLVITDPADKVYCSEGLATVGDVSGAEVVLFPARVATAALGVLGLLASLLAVTGVFGMAAYSVSRRLRELGIRRSAAVPGPG